VAFQAEKLSELVDAPVQLPPLVRDPPLSNPRLVRRRAEVDLSV
jgi:hypothetical protein